MKTFLFCLCIVDPGTIMGFLDNLIRLWRLSPKGGILSYAKSTHLENTSLWYTSYQQLVQIKPAFYSSYLTCNIPHSGDVIVQVFHLPWWRYSYLTQPSIMESYSCQCLNTETSAWGIRDYITEILSISYSTYLYIRLVITL